MAGLLLVISGPSGAGKGTLTKAVLARHQEFGFSVSATTRPPRVGEQDGVDYVFLSRNEFLRRLANDEFFEHTEIYGNLYGTLRAPIVRILADGRDVVMDVDTRGAARLRQTVPNAVFLFIVPPSLQELQSRIDQRGTEDATARAERLKRGWQELREVDGYDYVLVNRDIADATAVVEAIIVAERHRTSRQRSVISELREEGNV